MNERKYSVSSSQVFCFLLFYMLSGMILFCGGSFIAALFAVLFCACLFIIAASLCRESFSSAEFYGGILGKGGLPFRYIAAFFSALPFVRTVFAFSEVIARFHGAENSRFFAPVILCLCIISVAKSFSRAARFSELCIFPLSLALLLSLLGGSGEGLYFSFDGDLLFTGFEVIGAAPVFFSLYLRCVGEQSEKMSDFAKNSSFQPSPLGAGILALGVSLSVYAFFCFTGLSNILISFMTWFFALARLSLFSLAFSDLVGSTGEIKGQRTFFTATLFCAFWVIFGAYYPDVANVAGAFANVIFPCAVFVLNVFTRGHMTAAKE